MEFESQVKSLRLQTEALAEILEGIDVTGKLSKSANLSDVENPVTALNNILPDQTGHGGKTLQTNGSLPSWEPSDAGDAIAYAIALG